jgi:hypothetical protein
MKAVASHSSKCISQQFSSLRCSLLQSVLVRSFIIHIVIVHELIYVRFVSTAIRARFSIKKESASLVTADKNI